MIQLEWVEVPNRPKNHKPLHIRMGLDRLALIMMLDKDFEYSPGEVAATRCRVGSKAFLKIRASLESFATKNDLETTFDNTDKPDSEPKRWCGSSWQECLTSDHRYFIGKLMDELKAAQEKSPGIYYLNCKKVLTKARPKRRDKAPANRNNKKTNEAPLAEEQNLSGDSGREPIASDQPIDKIDSSLSVSTSEPSMDSDQGSEETPEALQPVGENQTQDMVDPNSSLAKTEEQAVEVSGLSEQEWAMGPSEDETVKGDEAPNEEEPPIEVVQSIEEEPPTEAVQPIEEVRKLKLDPKTFRKQLFYGFLASLVLMYIGHAALTFQREKDSKSATLYQIEQKGMAVKKVEPAAPISFPPISFIIENS